VVLELLKDLKEKTESSFVHPLENIQENQRGLEKDHPLDLYLISSNTKKTLIVSLAKRKSLSMSNVRSVVTSGRQILRVKTTPVTVVLSTVSSPF